MLDAMIAALRKRVRVEEQGAHKDDRFSRGRLIACVIYEYFRATGACEAVQGLSTLFAVSLQSDDVQDFDVRWDPCFVNCVKCP